MVSCWSLSDSKSPQTLLVFWMISTHPVNSKSPSTYTNTLVTIQRTPITICITITFMFQSFFFNSLARSRYLFSFLLSFNFTLCISFSRTDSELCIYHLFAWSDFNFLHNSQWITLPTQLCLVLCSFGANLLYSFIMQLIISSMTT